MIRIILIIFVIIFAVIAIFITLEKILVNESQSTCKDAEILDPDNAEIINGFCVYEELNKLKIPSTYWHPEYNINDRLFAQVSQNHDYTNPSFIFFSVYINIGKQTSYLRVPNSIDIWYTGINQAEQD